MRYFSAFSGIGGFEIALGERGHECVGFCEIDRYARQIYLRHFPSHRPHGDVTTLEPAALSDFELLVGGFPCQAFSIAGKRRGFLDPRGTLFFELCRLAKAKRPSLLLFENVKGLLHHASGETFRVILSALDELGYDVQWQVCNSRHFGVPQNRERVFLVGRLGGQPGPEVFPLGEDEIEPAAAVEAVACLNANYGKGSNRDSKNRRTLIARWVNGESGATLDDTAPTLRASGGIDLSKMPAVVQRARGNNPGGIRADGLTPTLQQGFGDGNVAILAVNQQREVREKDVAAALPTSRSSTPFQAVIYEQNIDGKTRAREVCPALRSPNTISNMPVVIREIPLQAEPVRLIEMYPGHAVNEPDGVARTLKAGVHGVPGGEGVVRNGLAIRRLTPVECERLQAYPDGWTEFGIDDNGNRVRISDTQRYKCVGNAVTVSVIRAIVTRLGDGRAS